MSNYTLRQPIAPIRWIRAFLNSPVYIAAIAAIVAYGCVFGTESFTFFIYMVAVILTAVFSEDTVPTAVLWAFGYITFSRQNNPGMYVEGEETVSCLYDPAFLSKFITIIVVIFISAILKAYLCLDFPGNKKIGKMSVGCILLGVSFLLGGLLSPYYSGKTAVFGLVEILSLAISYVFLIHTVNRKRLPKNLYGWIFTFMGLALVAETFGMYYNADFEPGEIFIRAWLYTGWGIYNNVGGMLIMCVPAPFFLMVQRKRVLPYAFLSSVIMVGVFLTQSRNCMLCGSFIFLLCLLFAFVYLRGSKRFLLGLWCLFLLLAVAAVFAVYREAVLPKLLAFYDSMLVFGFSLGDRLTIWETGWKQFREYPIFGNGFYRADTFIWGNLNKTSFLPPRYHNTVIQLLASGGVVAMAAYLVHRVQTVVIFLRRKPKRAVFIFLSVLAFCLSSLADNFFFNFGPGLSYGLLLFFLETEEKRKKKVRP